MRLDRFALIVVLMLLAPAAWGATIPVIWDSNFGPVLFSGDDSVAVSQPIGVTFPFLGTNYTDVTISTNGFIQLGGTDGPGCCSGNVTGFLNGFARISPAWLDWTDRVYLNTFADHATITWDGAETLTGAIGQFQLQLYTDGLIIFGYNALGFSAHVGLVGVTPGGGAADPGGTNFVPGQNLIAGPTVYQTAGGLSYLEGYNIVFTPDSTTGGWVVDTTPEPSTFGLLAIGAGAFVMLRRRKCKA